MSPKSGAMFVFLKWAYMLAVATVLAWVLFHSGLGSIRWRSLLLSPGPWAFMVAWAAMAVLLGGLWAVVLRWRFELRLPASQWLPLQSLAWAGRYLPGKVGLLAGKMSLLSGGKLSLRALTQSVLVEQLAFVFAGAGLGCLLLLALPAEEKWLTWLPDWMASQWAWLPALGVAGSCVGFALGLRLLDRIVSAPGRPVSIPRTAWLLLGYAVPHVLVGLGFHALLHAFLPPGSQFGPLQAIAIMAFANVAGILAVFAPAGMGVREAVLAFGLTGVMPFPQALALATVLRALSILADAALALLGGGLPLLGRTLARTSPGR